MTAKNTSTKPIAAAAAQTCCGAKPRASRGENAPSMKAGANCSPISARPQESTIAAVQTPPTGASRAEAGDELHNARRREIGVVARGGSAPIADFGGAELGQQRDETAEPAEFDPGDDADRDERRRQTTTPATRRQKPPRACRRGRRRETPARRAPTWRSTQGTAPPDST